MSYDLAQDKSFLHQRLEATLSTCVSWHQLGATTHRGFLRDLTDRLLLGQALAKHGADVWVLALLAV